MASTTRRARSYKEKSSIFTFGHFALPVAAVIALGLLFVGIKLFFLTPPQKVGVEAVVVPGDGETEWGPAPPIAEQPDFALAESDYGAKPVTGGPEKLETTDVSIILAGPLTQTGSPAKTPVTPEVAKAEAKRGTASAAVRTQTSQASVKAKTNANPNAKWGVQIGAFVNENSASTLLSDVKKLGYLASISKVDSSGKTFHRVRIGAGNTREDAAHLASELKEKGYPVSVVPML
jgi:cell division septation protein DedD